ncbi:hypothetical protein FRC90_14790 [Paracidovorax citrulli]|nr:hypothetical protein FRC90_14790 [Paracidovorax citrulli]
MRECFAPRTYFGEQSAWAFAERSDGPVHPFWMRPRSPCGRTGSHPTGSPFLWLLSFGEAKESNSPAGARPGPRP